MNPKTQTSHTGDRVETALGAEPAAGAKDVVAALRINAAVFAYDIAYQEQLKLTVFPMQTSEAPKVRIANRRVLSNLNTLRILQSIWKESRHVRDADLRRAGLKRAFADASLTVHGLTIVLFEESRTVSAAIKRVGRIVRAAKAYGLIETRPIGPKKIEIAGTTALHELMLRVVEDFHKALDGRPLAGREMSSAERDAAE